MKKLLFLIVVIVVLGLIVSGCSLLGVTPVEKEETGILTKAPKVKPPSGAHYNLNIIGKKSDWNGGGNYDNPDRHTMFVPEDTSGLFIPTPGDDDTTNIPDLPGIKIEMTQGDEFAVLDGNAFGDGRCAFQLAPGKYEVWITAKAKPPKPGEDYYTNIGGWVFAADEYGDNYYFNIGSVTVKKKLGWLDATHIFYVSPGEDWFGIIENDMWVFEYLSYLTEWDFGDDYPDITDAAYFWQYDNHGNKLVKVRFYKR
ncbi:MAG: hypothetical protein U9R12_03170 [Candidatus Caldatribacteriota bacterium]|nr:hypothetical protein [Candidatus Caldatribacteriota bacterium]